MLDINEEGPEFHSVTAPPAASAEIPQFATAEYAHIPGTERCQICGNLIPAEYYRINGRMACANCAQQSMAGQPTDSHVAFGRSLFFGAGAALVGLAVYATVVIITHWTIGYLALGVGWLVAKAMMKGSNGFGGRRYQIAAVLLTYAAISLSAIPIGVSYAVKHGADHPKSAHVSQNPFPEDDSRPKSASHVGLGAAMGGLLLLGIASPFMALSTPASGAIGLFILFIGLRIAWQLTGAKPLAVDGPYSGQTV